MISSSKAGLIYQPGSLIGIPSGASLPEGVYFSDLEHYGHADHALNYSGGNTPAFIWSTPYSYSDTRLEFFYIFNIVHQNGGPSQATNRTDVASQAFGPTLAHNFGHDFHASLNLFFRTPDNHFIGSSAADLRLGLSYIPKGYNFSATFGYNGVFGSHSGTPPTLTPTKGISGAADTIDLDFTATKRFGKLEMGVVGFALTELNTRRDSVGFNSNGTTYAKRAGEIAVGGLLGYDFGRFSIQTYVVRDVAKRFAFNGTDATGTSGFGAFSTRGFIRVFVPLYVASKTERTMPVRDLYRTADR